MKQIIQFFGVTDVRTSKKVSWGETFYVDQSQLRSRTTLELRIKTIADKYEFSHHIMIEITWGVPECAHTYAASDEGFVPSSTPCSVA